MMRAGLHHDIPNEAYHSGPGLSHSGVKRLRRTPFHFRALLDRTDAAPRSTPSPQMINGTLTHCALLEPLQFDSRYVIGPEISKNSKLYKDFAASLPNGVELISQQQRDAAFRQAEALRELPDIGTLLSSGDPEVSAFWTDADTGVLCKCRPDWVSPVGYGNGVVLLDVKTAADASPEGFAKAVANFGYHTQADWYCAGYSAASGLDVHGMVFAVVESEFPHACAAYMLDDTALARARDDNRAALRLYAKCETAQSWPGYSPAIQIITLPRWA